MAARLAPTLLVQEPVNRLISAAVLLLVACAPASQGDDAESDEGALGGTGTAGTVTLGAAVHAGKIIFNPGTTGTYTIDATSYGQLATGSYSIQLQ